MSSAIEAARHKSLERDVVCDLSSVPLNLDPFPHVINPEFIAPEIYEQVRSSFPQCPPSTGPTGFSLYWGDDGYTELLNEQPAWRALFNTFHSQRFIDWGKQQFESIWATSGCQLNLSEAHYVPYREDRIDKERPTLREVEHEPHELWVRMDIHQGQVGYDRPIHVDHARRLISMLIYMCDQTKNEMVGGELLLHRGRERKAVARITPRENLMVAFPCAAQSYHSVSEITSARTPRNYVQVHISSSVDVWHREPASPDWRHRYKSLKRRIKNLV